MSLPIACRKCCTNCLKMHGKSRTDPSMHYSFFKIMFGNRFDEYLVLPPAFAKRFQSHENKRITLQDANRRHWDVLLRKVNGSLAFEKGWHNFVIDHNIEMGDLLVFDHFREAHFIVDIFGRSGCPKQFAAVTANKYGASERYRSSIPTKRSFDSYRPSAQKMAKNVRVAKTHIEPRSMTSPDKSRPSVVPLPETSVEPCFMSSREKAMPNVASETFVEPCFTSSRDQSKKPKRASVTESVVEPCFMTSREKNSAAVYDREVLFDLSTFEIPVKKPMKKEPECHSDFSGELHRQGDMSDISRNTAIGMADNEIIFDHHDVGDSAVDMAVPEMPENEKGHPYGDLHATESEKYQNAEIKAASVNLQNCQISERNAEVPSESHPAELKIVCVDFTENEHPTTKVEDNVNAIVKAEPLACYASSATVVKVACLVPPHSNFLELPIYFPVVERVRSGRYKQTCQLVFLRDPAGRLWPVAYHDNKGHKVLTTGWKAFTRANNIESGGECVFTVENSEECKFTVQVFPHTINVINLETKGETVRYKNL